VDSLTREEKGERSDVTGVDSTSKEARRLLGGVVSRLERRDEEAEKELNMLLSQDLAEDTDADEFRRER
jgi:hypothetical protein